MHSHTRLSCSQHLPAVALLPQLVTLQQNTLKTERCLYSLKNHSSSQLGISFFSFFFLLLFFFFFSFLAESAVEKRWIIISHSCRPVHAMARGNEQFLPSGRKCIVKVKRKPGDEIKVICPRSHSWKAEPRPEMLCGFVRCFTPGTDCGWTQGKS